MNYGTLTIVDGVYQPEGPSDERMKRGMVRLGGALAPNSRYSPKPGGTTFVVNLSYTDRAYHYGNGGPVATDIRAAYSRQFKRLASGGNPLKEAKNFVAQFAGCEEAQKLRGRVIAISRVHKTIYGETFRFPVEAP